MARKDPNKFEVKGNPSTWVTIARHSRDGIGDKDSPWHYTFWRDGKRHRGSTGKLDHAEAVAVARGAAEKVMTTVQHSATALTIAQAVEAYKNTRWPEGERAGNRTYQDFKSRLAALVAWTGDTALSTMDAEEARKLTQRYINNRSAKGASGQTLLNDRLVLSRFFASLIKDGTVAWTFNPAAHDRLTLKRIDRHDPKQVTDKDLETLLREAKGRAVYPLIVLCLGAGLRPAEASRVAWRDINFDTGTITVFGKSRGRTPIMSAWIRSELEALQTASPDADTASRLFPHNSFTAFDWFADVRKAAKLPDDVSLQSLRRAAARRSAPRMTMMQYAAYFGHSLAVAQRHYIGYGLDGQGNTVNVSGLDFSDISKKASAPPNKAPHKNGAKVMQVKSA
jgi:integrase